MHSQRGIVKFYLRNKPEYLAETKCVTCAVTSLTCQPVNKYLVRIVPSSFAASAAASFCSTHLTNPHV
jgi:hypothetical protein